MPRPLPPLLAKALSLKRSPWFRRIVCTLMVLLIALSLLNAPAVQDIGVDQSWQAALAHFFKVRAQAGVDYIFTFGPLGYFSATAFDPDLYWHKYAWELLLKLAFAVILVKLAARLPNLVCAALFVGLVVLFLGVNPLGPDALYLVVMISVSAFLLESRQFSAAVAAQLALLAILSLVKFTFLLVALADVVVVVFHHVRQGRPRQGSAMLAAFLVTILAIWLALGQALGNIPSYLRGSWEIAAGYAEAMGLEGNIAEILLALAIIVGIVLQMLVLITPEQSRAGFASLCLIVALHLFLQWKHGFVRHDAHAFGFFSVALVVPFILLAFSPEARWRLLAGQILAVGCIGLSIVGTHWATKTRWAPDFALDEWWARLRVNSVYVLSPRWTKAWLASLKPQNWERWQLPKMAAMVREGSTDLISSMPGILFANHLAWRPRPVFQSYSAYTPYLLRANASFFASERAPDFVVMAPSPIDQHFPALEDCLALREIFRRYAPATLEKECVLLQRLTGPLPPPLPRRTLLDRSVVFDEVIPLPAGRADYQLLALEFRTTLYGMLRAFLYKPPTLWMTITTSDDRRLRYRIVPAMAQEGFLINPFLGNYDDILRIYGKPNPILVKTLQFSVEGGAGCYLDRIHLTLQSDPGLVTYKLALTPR